MITIPLIAVVLAIGFMFPKKSTFPLELPEGFRLVKSYKRDCIYVEEKKRFLFIPYWSRWGQYSDEYGGSDGREYESREEAILHIHLHLEQSKPNEIIE